MYFQKAVILGVGLIGASVALALKKNNLANAVVGCGRSEENLMRAKERAIIDSFALDPATACDGADLIIFATPVGVFTNVAKQIAHVLKKNAIVTDVGSVKGDLVRYMEGLLAPNGCFVGGHPIAGSDRSGIDSASAHLFDKARCIITPTDTTDKNALEQIISMWRIFGSIVALTEPDEHDRIYASVSHLPHLLAYELVNTVADIDPSYLTFSGKGFKDTTRIASSHPELWRDICLLNRKNLLAYIELFKKNLDRASIYLRDGDGDSLLREFQNAYALRESIGQD